MSREAGLGTILESTRRGRPSLAERALLPAGWVLAAVGYFGPWIAHGTSALTLSGVDMGEFVKFLPAVLDGTLQVVRQFFYLPPLAIVVGVALLVGSRRLDYPWPVRACALVLAVPVSLQILPPAWSPASLMTPEFRLQTVVLVACWFLLAGFWLWGRLPLRSTGSLAASLAVGALVLSIWQFLVVKPAIDQIYGTPPVAGWGLYACLFGLAMMAGDSASLAWRRRARVDRP